MQPWGPIEGAHFAPFNTQVEVLEACENAECFDKLISMRISPQQLLSEHASVAKGRRAPVRPLDGVLFELLASRNAEGAEPPAAEGLAPSVPVTSPPPPPNTVAGDHPSGGATVEAGESLEMSSQPLEMSRGYEVLLRMLEHPDGLRQLEGCGWVQGELAAWQAHRCAQYATALEQQTVAALKSEPINAEAHARTCALVPPHLYAALCATRQGCELLHGASILAQACQELTQTQAPSLQRRAALWAVAHACSCSCGFAFVVGQVREVMRMHPADKVMRLRRCAPRLQLYVSRCGRASSTRSCGSRRARRASRCAVRASSRWDCSVALAPRHAANSARSAGTAPTIPARRSRCRETRRRCCGSPTRRRAAGTAPSHHCRRSRPQRSSCSCHNSESSSRTSARSPTR